MLDLKERLALKENLVHQDHREYLDLRERRENVDPEEILVLLVHSDLLVREGHLETEVFLVKMAYKVQRVHKETVELQEPLALKVLLEIQEEQVNQVYQEQEV